MRKQTEIDEATQLAFRSFGQEYDHIKTSEHAHSCGNHEDGRGYQETADLCLNLGWETLEGIGWRHCDIARFRHFSQVEWAKKFPMGE